MVRNCCARTFLGGILPCTVLTSRQIHVDWAGLSPQGDQSGSDILAGKFEPPAAGHLTTSSAGEGRWKTQKVSRSE